MRNLSDTYTKTKQTVGNSRQIRTTETLMPKHTKCTCRGILYHIYYILVIFLSTHGYILAIFPNATRIKGQKGKRTNQQITWLPLLQTHQTCNRI